MVSILNIKEYGEEVLRKKAKPVEKIEDSHRNLIHDMVETMIDKNGIGLAANQVGVLERIIVIKDFKKPPKTIAMINPEILSDSGDSKDVEIEGCLSIPAYSTSIWRPGKVTVRFLNEDGQQQVQTFDGMGSRVVQHEIDHLNGILFIDRIPPFMKEKEEQKLKTVRMLQEEKGLNTW